MTQTVPPATLQQLQKLAARNGDTIKLAVALAHLDASKSPAPMTTLMQATGKSRRTINYLKSIGRRLDELGLAERTFISLGWTKSVEIARLCTKETVSDALAYADEHTAVQLRNYLTGETDSKKSSAILLRLRA